MCTGKRFMYSVGSELRLVVRDAEVAKEVLSNKMGYFERTPLDLYIFGHLIGNGIFVVKGEQWALQRRILNPFFSNESLKVRDSSSLVLIFSPISVERKHAVY